MQRKIQKSEFMSSFIVGFCSFRSLCFKSRKSAFFIGVQFEKSISMTLLLLAAKLIFSGLKSFATKPFLWIDFKIPTNYLTESKVNWILYSPFFQFNISSKVFDSCWIATKNATVFKAVSLSKLRRSMKPMSKISGNCEGSVLQSFWIKLISSYIQEMCSDIVMAQSCPSSYIFTD